MLRITDEILLLILDNEEGDVTPSLPPHSLNMVIAGAVLMDLALSNRIDTDLEKLTIVDAVPVGDSLLDPILADIVSETAEYPIDYWLGRIARQGDEIRFNVLSGLIDSGILATDDFVQFFLSQEVSRTRRYLSLGPAATDDVQVRIMKLLFSDEIPDPRDVVIIALAASCDLFRYILSADELAIAKDRIDLIGRMDLIGQSVARSLRNAEAPPPPPAARPPTEIPQVSGLPLLGNVLDVSGNLSAFLVKQYRELGPVFQFRALNRHYIALAGPDANQFVQKRGRIHLRSHETWQGFNKAMGAKDALTSLDGPGHVRMRKVHTRAFSRGFIEDRLVDVVDSTRRRVAEWPRGRPISAQYAMQEIIAEQLALLTTGVSILDYIDDLIETLDGLLKVHVMQQRPAWILRLPRQRRIRRRLDRLHAKVMAHHQGSGRPDPDLIDDLLDLHKSDPQFFPETDVRLAALGPFFAGVETAASTSAFMLYALLKHPELLARMTVEAEEFFGRGPTTAKRLRALDVAHRTVLETLRLYPTVPALPRTVANSFDFAGYTIPARARILIGNTVPHHLPEFFPDPDRFDIDRYTAERAEHMRPGAFAPFGLGTHRCLGSRFAETQIAITLLTIIRDVELALDPHDYELKVDHTPTPHPARSFRFRVVGGQANGQVSRN